MLPESFQQFCGWAPDEQLQVLAEIVHAVGNERVANDWSFDDARERTVAQIVYDLGGARESGVNANVQTFADALWGDLQIDGQSVALTENNETAEIDSDVRLMMTEQGEGFRHAAIFPSEGIADPLSVLSAPNLLWLRHVAGELMGRLGFTKVFVGLYWDSALLLDSQYETLSEEEFAAFEAQLTAMVDALNAKLQLGLVFAAVRDEAPDKSESEPRFRYGYAAGFSLIPG